MATGTHYHFESMRTARLLMGSAVLVVVLAVVLVPMLLRSGNGYGVLSALIVTAVAVWLGFLAVSYAPDSGLLFERDTRRKFQAVCLQKHLAGVDAQTKRPYFPQLSQLIGSGSAWSVTIRPLLGQSMADYERAAPAFAMAFGVSGVRFSHLAGGRINMKAGFMPLESRTLVLPSEAETGTAWRERLATVAVGVTDGGQGFVLPLLDSHVLIAGITGAGKGSVIWSIILGLTPALRAGVVKLWGFDPKRVELHIGRPLFGDRYANTPEEMVQLLERAHADMQHRAGELAERKVRRFEPSEVHPFNVLVVDELGYLSALLPDRKLRQRADDALSGILVLGRAVGYCVVGALQDPRKETLSYRDLFPTRVAMKLPKPMVDLVLGHGMHEAGAYCDLIPDPRHGGAGMAYVLGEGSSTPRLVRMTWCPDELITSTAALLGAGGPLPIGE